MKKFLIKISYIVLPIYIIMLGLVAYVTLYISPRADSDLGSLALIPFGVEYSQSLMKYGMEDTLFIKVNHTEELRNIHVNVLTVGDSFSQQGNIGYQNYMPVVFMRILYSMLATFLTGALWIPPISMYWLSKLWSVIWF